MTRNPANRVIEACHVCGEPVGANNEYVDAHDDCLEEANNG